MALTTSGMVMNGPTPIMSIMFSEVADHNPIPRMRSAEAAPSCEEDGEEGCISWKRASILGQHREFGRSAFSAAISLPFLEGL